MIMKSEFIPMEIKPKFTEAEISVMDKLVSVPPPKIDHTTLVENVIKDLLKQLLKREPEPEDARRLHFINHANDTNNTQVYFDGVFVGIVKFGFDLSEGLTMNGPVWHVTFIPAQEFRKD